MGKLYENTGRPVTKRYVKASGESLPSGKIEIRLEIRVLQGSQNGVPGRITIGIRAHDSLGMFKRSNIIGRVIRRRDIEKRGKRRISFKFLFLIVFTFTIRVNFIDGFHGEGW
jgi:hypothetical protein